MKSPVHVRIETIEILDDLLPFAPTSIKLGKSNEGQGEVHLFTGPNGTGKSRLLSACASIGLHLNLNNQLKSPRFPAPLSLNFLGHPNPKAKLSVFSGKQKILQLEAQLGGAENGRSGLSIFAFKGSSTLEQAEIGVLQTAVIPDVQQRLSFRPPPTGQTNQRIADMKIQAVMDSMEFGETGSEGSHSSISRLEQEISRLTGKPFSVVTRRKPSVGLYFKWGKDILPISSLPDGLNSVLSWIMEAATVMELIYPDSPDPLAEPAIFFLDEPETHLHPQWQRHILPLAQKLFRNSQIFVATHSPFVVSSLNDGFIYQLKKNQEGKVTVSAPHEASKGDSYISAAERFLETGEWFDPESEGLLSQFREKRNLVMHGDLSVKEEALSLGYQISQRSQELANIIGPEISRLEKL